MLKVLGNSFLSFELFNFEYSIYLNPSTIMKKLLFVLAFSAMGFAAQAQCSKNCSTSAGCDKKKESASISTAADKAVASTQGNTTASSKNVAVASKKRRSKSK